MLSNLSLIEKLSDISFCDKQCSNVNDDSTKDKIISYIQDKLNVNIIDRIYMVLRPNFLKNISYNQHVVSLLSHGNPYLLYLTKVDGVNCCFYIDRKLKNGFNYPKIHSVKYRFDDELYNDTILSGELVRDSQRKWFFLISDILVRNGQLYRGKKTVLSRYQEINDIIVNKYKKDSELEPCPLFIKKLFMYKDIKNIVSNFIPNLSYKTKGIIFYTLSNKHSDYLYIIPNDKTINIRNIDEVRNELKRKEPSLFDFDDNINDKMKESRLGLSNPMQTNDINNISNELESEKNIVFKILKTETSDIYNLYVNDNDNLYKHDIALIPNLILSKMLRNIFNNDDNKLGVNMECKYSYVFEKWIPFRISNLEIFTKKKLMCVITTLNNSKINNVL